MMGEKTAGDAVASERPQGRLGEFFDLDDRARAALTAILGPLQQFPRDHVLRRDGVQPTHLFLLLDGWVASSIGVTSGRQQTVKIHLPGDLLGAPSLSVTHAAECLSAITPISVRAMSRRDLMGVFSRFPKVAASMFLSAQRERVALMESLALVGQTRGEVRLAGMLIHLFDRLKPLGQTKANVLPFPLTQAQIGDLVGLSVVHVSRKLVEMERDGLIRRGGKTMTLLDLDRLRAMSGLPVHTFVHEPDWIRFI